MYMARHQLLLLYFLPITTVYPKCLATKKLILACPPTYTIHSTPLLLKQALSKSERTEAHYYTGNMQ